MKGKKVYFLLGFFLAIPLVVVSQQSGSSVKIGVLNTNRVVRESTEGKAFLARIQNKQQAKEAEVKAQQQSILEAQQLLQRQASSLSEEARLRKQQELEQRVRQLNRFKEDAQAELNAYSQEQFANLGNQMMPVINQLAKEEGYSLILEASSGMLYVDPAIDITDKVIARFNALSQKTAKPAPTKK
jgi:outer membrane protein